MICLRALLVIFLLNNIATNAGAAIPVPKVKKINERVYALLGPVGFPDKNNQGYMVNSTVIIGDKGVILIDTGFTDEIGRHIAKTIKGITSKPVTHIINTHHHGDHVLGNSEFKGASIISAAKCAELLNRQDYAWIDLVERSTGRKFPNTRPVLAKTVYKENTHSKVTLQGIELELWVPTGSHTAGDLLIYLPKDKVLVAGDILVNTMIPSFRDAHIKTWLGTLRQIMKKDIDTVVPGHGTLMSLGDVKKFNKMMSDFYAGVEAGYKKGLMDSEIRKTLDLTEWKKLVEFDGLMGSNINRAFLEAEMENF